ncbi:pentatricopeptide repeat-containing protein 1, mitochondrial-like [Uloborus diversus]|uniref:pentatricopeptide repeat-containing protein 1, mitochondrial-like n=1 Tax=Uloborus diversus TaxID=327109 RepID=UPI002409466A|nr:pentatricopeptide repeat-containing protein 1, mitochondrial-like [Uloborus diversus]
MLFISRIQNRMPLISSFINLPCQKLIAKRLCIPIVTQSNEMSSNFSNKLNDSTPSKSSEKFGTLKKSLEPSVRNTKVSPRVIKINKKTLEKHRSDAGDEFGNLSDTKPVYYPDVHEDPKEDNEQDDDSVIVKNLSKKLRCPRAILSEMKKLVKEKKIKEALGFFVTMKRNQVAPIHPHYTYMIGVCGRIGYTEMAFKLLRQMTDRKMQPTPATLTGLFNSCAECPFPEYGLEKAKLLKEKIEAKNWHLTQITYHSMIKAFGKCGDIQTAFQIVDEMTKADIKIDAVTYSFLLMSCIANKEAGFTHAVEVWRQMRKRKIVPNLFTCNLLLRATRDCSIGPEEISSLLLQHWSSFSRRPYGFEAKKDSSQEDILSLPFVETNQNTFIDSNVSDAESEAKPSPRKECEKIFQENDEKINDLVQYDLKNAVGKVSKQETSVLLARPKDGPEILELLNINKPSDRLLLVGGMEGFLKYLKEIKVKPDIKTFMLLLECLPADTEQEEKLLNLLDFHKVKPDIDFFNILIKRRNFRRENENARKVLLLVNKYGLEVDIATFGVLATGCRTHYQAVNFLNEMEKLELCPNNEIIGALIGNACYSVNFNYLKLVLKFIEEKEIKPNDRIISKIEGVLNTARNNIIKYERGEETLPVYQNKEFAKNYKAFCIFYEEWLKNMDFEIPQHPWSQYSTEIIDKAKKEELCN